MLTYLGFQAIGGLSSLMPRTWQYQIAHRVADLHYLLDRRARESVHANLRVILGPTAPESIVRYEARWVFRSFGMYLCEFFGHRRFGPKFLDEHVMVQGREHLDAALAKGNGAICCSAHYSNWELGAKLLARLGYPFTAIVQMHANPKVNAMFVRQRAEFGINVVPTQFGAKAALKALHNNQVVAVLGDRTTGGPVVPVTLFGRRMYLPQGPWRMSLATGAPLLPTLVHRRFNRNYTLEIGPPIHPPESGPRNECMAYLAQQWASWLEGRLRADPCQWAVFFRVWDDPISGELGREESLAEPQQLALNAVSGTEK